MAKRKLQDMLWAGTEASYQSHVETETRAGEIQAHSSTANAGADTQTSYLLDVQGNIGVINIAGPLSNNDSWMNEMMGVASYPAIQEALVAAAQNPDVTDIVLNINSGGGPVNGLSDTAALVSMISAKIKPIVAYTDGKMCSAAYWLGCAADKVYASNVSEVGSIGVIATHMDYSAQLKADGITATVMRAGQFKALANSVEPLTAAAKAQIQASLDEAYKVFVQHVALARNQSYDYVDANMAQGREFFGAQALAAGLVDGITSFGELMSNLEKKALDNASHYGQTSKNSSYGATQMKKVLTAQQIAALASGAGIQASAGDAAAAVAAHDAPAVLDAEVAAKAETDAAAITAAVAAEVTQIQEGTQASVVSFLQAQVKEKDTAFLQASIKLAGLEARIADQEASFAGLIGIAATSLSNMQVALGGSAIAAEGMTAVTVLAEHKRVSDLFQTKFKAGGVAAVAAATDVDDAEVQVDPLMQARMDSYPRPAKAK